MDSLWFKDIKFYENKNDENKNLETEICIVGAGIFGMTCAYYLTKLGYKVIVVDKDRIGFKTTGHTTAKITSEHGLFYDYLVNSYSKEFSKDYLKANEQAIDNIEEIIKQEKINCDFTRENHFVYTTKQEDIVSLKKEVKALQDIGFKNFDFVTKTGLPFEIQGAICFKNQAKFHPLKYLYGLCNSIISNGGQIFTNSAVYDVEKNVDGYTTYLNKYKINSKYVIIATHYPIINFPGFYFTKMYQSTSYLIAVDPKKTLFNGMYISSSNPVFSFRTAKYGNKDLLIVGGGEHKTGQPTSYENSYGLLETEARKYYPDLEVLFRWNTRDCISLDKIPYIGQYSLNDPNMFVRNRV